MVQVVPGKAAGHVRAASLCHTEAWGLAAALAPPCLPRPLDFAELLQVSLLGGSRPVVSGASRGPSGFPAKKACLPGCPTSLVELLPNPNTAPPPLPLLIDLALAGEAELEPGFI